MFVIAIVKFNVPQSERLFTTLCHFDLQFQFKLTNAAITSALRYFETFLEINFN